MKRMLDTNICVAVIRGKRLDVVDRMEALEGEGIYISAVAHSELLYGCYKSKAPKKTKCCWKNF